MTTPSKTRRVKAWAIVHARSLDAWGTHIGRERIWQYPIFYGKKSAIKWTNWKSESLPHEKYSIIPCTIEYSLPKSIKKK